MRSLYPVFCSNTCHVIAFLNGIFLRSNIAIKGQTEMDRRSAYTKHGALPIMPKDHCDPSPAISFCNILGKAIVFFLLPATEFLLGLCCVALFDVQ